MSRLRRDESSIRSRRERPLRSRCGACDDAHGSGRPSHHTNDCAGSTRVWTPIIPAVVKTRIECFWGERHHVVAPVETPQPSVELVFAEAVVAHGRKTVVSARADASWHFQPSSEFFIIVIKTSQPRQADSPWRGGTDPPTKTSEPQF